MILESSAVIAVIVREASAAGLVRAIAADPSPAIGAPTLSETGIVLTARLGPLGRTVLARFVAEAAVTVVPFTEAHWQVAVEAFQRFGKGRHPAGLNFGDCMSYATARIAGEPLLCVGEDFRRTDLRLA